MTAEVTSLADAYDLERVRTTPAPGIDFMAQVAAYEERQAQRPDRRHWLPVDQTDPGDEGPDRVLDGDVAEWKRLTRGPNAGKWRMRGFDPAKHEDRAGRALTWQEDRRTRGRSSGGDAAGGL